MKPHNKVKPTLRKVLTPKRTYQDVQNEIDALMKELEGMSK